MTGWLQAFLTHFTYLALVAVLLAAGMGIPIPEDIPLIFSGYLCNKTHSPVPAVVSYVDTNNDGIPDRQEIRPPRVPRLSLMIISGMVGVLGGDSMIFFIGRRGIDANNFVARHIRKVLHSKRREKAERHFSRHGLLTVFCGRFMPGFRSLVFAMAGMSKMSYVKFICIDGIAAAISVPTFILVGYHFAEHIQTIFDFIHKTKAILTPIAIAAVLAALLLYWTLKRRPKPQPVADV